MTERERMVETQIRARGVRDPAVLEAMVRVPREAFVRPDSVAHAFGDHPLAIDCGQTISQPYIVAYMTGLLRVRPGDRVLEVGTGSGYQTAVLLELTEEVFTIEFIPELYAAARKRLAGDRMPTERFRLADGHAGWPEKAPFDRIIVTAAATEMPEALVEQLACGGRMVIPIGEPEAVQRIVVVTRDGRGKLREEPDISVRFVPLVSGGGG
jgi:protein-L-isoaspartate(D-aspartate) O-methyltransferase